MKNENSESGSATSSVTMKNLNEFIITAIKNCMQPAQGEKFDFGDIMNLACMPSYKFLQAASNPFLLNGKAVTSPQYADWKTIIDGCLDFIQSPVMSPEINDQLALANGYSEQVSHQSILCQAWLKGPDATQVVSQTNSV